MKIKQPHVTGIEAETKLGRRLSQFNQLLIEIEKHKISEDLVSQINKEVDFLENNSEDKKALTKALPKSQHRVVQTAMKMHKLVPRYYYRNLWLAVGMASFGIPIGVAMGFALDNMAYIGIGLPIGLVIGMAIGSAMDKKAKEEGRQLNIDIEV